MGHSNNCAVKVHCVTSCPLDVSTELLTNISHSGLHSELITIPGLCSTATPARFPILVNSTTIHAVDQGALLFSCSLLANQSLDLVHSVSSIYPLSSLLLSLISLLQWAPNWVFCTTLFFYPNPFFSQTVKILKSAQDTGQLHILQ